MFATLFTTAAATGSNRTQSEEQYWSMWNDFQEIRWLPDIITFEEHDSRFQTFQDNVDKINRHNKEAEQGKHTWTMGVTPFADMTGDEFRTKVVRQECKAHFKKEAELNMAKHKLEQGRRRMIKAKSTGSVDWVSQGKVTAIKNQGQCGSCWAFSTTGSIESRSAIADNSSPISLSEQELVDCDFSSNGCGGGSMNSGFEYAMTHKGLCLESEYSYHAARGTCEASSCTHYDPITSFQQVSTSESALQTAVDSGPVSVAIDAAGDDFMFYSGGVFDVSDCGTSLDHGVLCVGYNNDATLPYWTIKNSWGTSWGEEGYIRLCKDCNKNDGVGECGLASDASYPIV